MRDVFHLPNPLYTYSEVGFKRVPSPIPQSEHNLHINDVSGDKSDQVHVYVSRLCMMIGSLKVICTSLV